MFIHLGENTVINSKEIITIIDLDSTTVSKITRDFLSGATKEKIVVNVSDELPKSAVICEKKGKRTVYISQISPKTLQKRLAKGKI